MGYPARNYLFYTELSSSHIWVRKICQNLLVWNIPFYSKFLFLNIFLLLQAWADLLLESPASQCSNKRIKASSEIA
jgi:hypothetical protein